MAEQRSRDERSIDLDAMWQRSAFTRAIHRVAGPRIERALAVERLNKGIRVWEDRCKTEDTFTSALSELRLRVKVTGGSVLGELGTGPLVVVGNHPFGGAEALALGSLLAPVRPNLKILATDMLLRIRPMRPYLIPIDSFGRWTPNAENVSSLRRTLSHLRSNGALLIFPAGRVSHLHLSKMRVTDPAWTAHAVRFARARSAKILPVFVRGRNGLLFQAAGLLHPKLRSALLARELYRTAGRGEIDICFGPLLEAGDLSQDDERATMALRELTYALGSRSGS